MADILSRKCERRICKKRRGAAAAASKSKQTTVTQAAKSNQRKLSTGVNKDGPSSSAPIYNELNRSSISEDDIPTSPMRMQESEEIRCNSPCRQPKSQQTHEREFLVRDHESLNTQTRGTIGLDQSANLTTLPSPLPPDNVPPTTQLTTPLGNPLLAAYAQQANAALLTYLQQNAVTPTLFNNGNILPATNVQTVVPQAQLANLGQTMAPIIYSMLNDNHSSSCIADTLGAVYGHLSLAALSMARAISLPTCGCALSVDRGVGASSSDSSATIPAYASEASSSGTSQNLPRPNPVYRSLF